MENIELKRYTDMLHFKVLTELESRIEVYNKNLSELEDTESNYTLKFYFSNVIKDCERMRDSIEEYFKEFTDRITLLEDIEKENMGGEK